MRCKFSIRLHRVGGCELRRCRVSGVSGVSMTERMKRRKKDAEKDRGNLWEEERRGFASPDGSQDANRPFGFDVWQVYVPLLMCARLETEKTDGR